jgi:quercetin dioxygenase-like cupin family protein
MVPSKPALLAAFVFLAAGPVAGQARAPGEADAGVRPTRLIDRDEIRASRVVIQPGAVRSVHAHNDVVYHLWIPLEGSLEITIESDDPTLATLGQAFFLERGTQHGFRNVGTTPAAVMEVFVKQTDIAALSDVLKELAIVRMARSQSAVPRPQPEDALPADAL